MTDTTNGIDYAAWTERNRAAAHVAPADGVAFGGWPKNEVRLFLQTVGRFVAAQTKPLEDEITRLKVRVAELEESGTKFCGTYQRANSYRRGEWVGYDGSGWVALVDVQPLEQPGASAKWQLVIRAGRDARDDTAANRSEPRKPSHR